MEMEFKNNNDMWIQKANTQARIINKANAARRIIDEAVEAYNLDAVYVMLSGGHDSLTTAAIASHHPAFKGCVHAKTNTGYISHLVTLFVRDVCKQRGWHLIEKEPVTTFAMLVAQHGYPGSSAHSMMYRMLKERPLRECKKQAVRDLKTQSIKKPKIGFITGIRRQESSNRAETPLYDKSGGTVYINAIADWSKAECEALMELYNVPKNPVKQTIGISGECGCGSHASPSEIKIRKMMYEQERRWIEALDKVVEAAHALQELEAEIGIRDKAFDRRFTRYGHGRAIPDEQPFLPGFSLCSGCVGTLDKDGNVADDPDLALLACKLEQSA